MVSRRPVRLLLVFLLTVGALGIRLYKIHQPPLDFHPCRQYLGAVIARAIYFRSGTDIPAWRRKIADLNEQCEMDLEPRITQSIAAFSYRLMGEEKLWVPRLLSIVFWLVGGVFLYRVSWRLAASCPPMACAGDAPGPPKEGYPETVARTVHPWHVALVSLILYLYCPFGIIGSRSFQPEPLMVMLMLLGLLRLAILFFPVPSGVPEPGIAFNGVSLLGAEPGDAVLESWRAVVLAAVATALAIFVKPTCAFLLGICLGAMILQRDGVRRALLNPRWYVFAFIALAPGALFYCQGVVGGGEGSLRDQASFSFLPQLLLQIEFWTRWWRMIGRAVGFIPLVAGLLGIRYCWRGLARHFVAGLWIGYFVYGLVFTWHIHTHDYYSLMLVPIVAITLGPVVVGCLAWARSKSYKQLATVVCAAALAAALVAAALLAAETLRGSSLTTSIKQVAKSSLGFVGVPKKFLLFLHPGNAEPDRIAESYREIGELVDHSTKTIFLVPDERQPIKYIAEIAGVKWPDQSNFRLKQVQGEEVLTPTELLGTFVRNNGSEYFIVTDMWEFEENQVELRQLLRSRYAVVAERSDFVIFDLRKPQASGPDGDGAGAVADEGE